MMFIQSEAFIHDAVAKRLMYTEGHFFRQYCGLDASGKDEEDINVLEEWDDEATFVLSLTLKGIILPPTRALILSDTLEANKSVAVTEVVTTVAIDGGTEHTVKESFVNPETNTFVSAEKALIRYCSREIAERRRSDSG